MKRLAIIGAGGVNSWFINYLKDVLVTFEKNELIYIKIFDNDVVEEKNLKRANQNFLIKELMMPKAEALANRYNFDFENTFINESNISKLENFDSIILGVDNHKTRKIIYEFAHKNKKYLLDIRANGTQMGYFVLDNNKDWDYYLKKHFSNSEVMKKKGSCQLTSDIENDNIQNGNKIIAFMCAYGIYLKHLRSEEPDAKEYKFAY